MKLLSKEKDLAKKTRVWIDLENGKAEMLKFDKDVTEEEAYAKMQKVLDRRQIIINERNAKIDEEIAKLQAEKDLLN